MDRIWRSSSFGWAVILATFGMFIWWTFSIPSPGKAVAALAVVAAVMSFRGETSGLEKTTWMLVLCAFLFIEVRAIDRDREEAAKQQQAARKQEDDRFAGLLKTQQDNFAEVLRKNQEAFDKTMARLTSLAGVIETVKVLSDRSLNKLTEKEGALVPGGSATPPNPCSKKTAAVYLYLGGVGVFADTLPHTVIRLNQRDILVIDKDHNGNLLVSSEIFDERGDLVARIDKNKFLATPASPRIEKSISSLRIYEHTDTPLLSVEFLNKDSVRIGGSLHSADGSLQLTVNEDNSVGIRMGNMNIARFAPGACFGSIDVCPSCR